MQFPEVYIRVRQPFLDDGLVLITFSFLWAPYKPSESKGQIEINLLRLWLCAVSATSRANIERV